MLANAFEECQSARSVLQSASFSNSRPPAGNPMQPLVSSQSFPHLWKKLWKFADLGRGGSKQSRIHWAFLQSFVGRCENHGPLVGRKPTEGTFYCRAQ